MPTSKVFSIFSILKYKPEEMFQDVVSKLYKQFVKLAFNMILSLIGARAVGLFYRAPKG
jgi:hypothetical protein